MVDVSLTEVWNSDSILNVYLTATKVVLADDGEIDTEEGWVDPRWSRWDVFDSRNDVEPIFQGRQSDYLDYWPTYDEAFMDFKVELKRVCAEYGCDLWDAQGDTNHYAYDEATNYRTGVSMMYCVHATTKGLNRDGLWEEYDVTF